MILLSWTRRNVAIPQAPDSEDSELLKRRSEVETRRDSGIRGPLFSMGEDEIVRHASV